MLQNASALDRVNFFNIGLMGLAAAAAFVFPFELFLAAYAILGPVHYLTEISWLHDRSYFAKSRHDSWWLWALAAIAAYPAALGLLPWVDSHDPLFIALASAVAMVFVGNTALRLFCFALFIGVSSLVSGTQFSFLLFGIYLPTLVHVFVFTGAFMLYGSLKEKSRSGYLSVSVLVALGLLCLVAPASAGSLPASDYVSDAVTAFGSLQHELARLLGWDLDGTGPLRAMRFIAFAYTYHYLNWFSKTKVIRWHQVSRRRLAAICALSVALIGTYAYDYRLGLTVLGLLSFGHVLLEFPLNIRCFFGIGAELLSRVKPTPTEESGEPTRLPAWRERALGGAKARAVARR